MSKERTSDMNTPVSLTEPSRVSNGGALVAGSVPLSLFPDHTGDPRAPRPERSPPRRESEPGARLAFEAASAHGQDAFAATSGTSWHVSFDDQAVATLGPRILVQDNIAIRVSDGRTALMFETDLFLFVCHASAIIMGALFRPSVPSCRFIAGSDVCLCAMRIGQTICLDTVPRQEKSEFALQGDLDPFLEAFGAFRTRALEQLTRLSPNLRASSSFSLLFPDA